VTQTITNIIIAAAAVIGLMPLGIRATRDLIKRRKRDKAWETGGTVALSVFLSLVAPGVLEVVQRHINAARDALPDWVLAAVPPPASDAQQPSPNGSGPVVPTQSGPDAMTS
jgi:hypothetical protein